MSAFVNSKARPISGLNLAQGVRKRNLGGAGHRLIDKQPLHNHAELAAFPVSHGLSEPKVAGVPTSASHEPSALIDFSEFLTKIN
jgi:hypothetical protein